jgi:plasmid stabilization system protein ParE
LSRTHAAQGIRRRPVGNYAIYYRVLDETVQVIRIVHAARDVGAISLG